MKRYKIIDKGLSKKSIPMIANQHDIAFYFVMKELLISRRLITTISILFFSINISIAQPIYVDQEQIAVQLTAEVQITPPKVTLSWRSISYGPPVYTKIYRKAKYANSWSILDSISYSNTDTTYTDTNVTTDSSFEYMVLIGGGPTTCPDGDYSQDGSLSVGFIHVGINAPPIHAKGTLILLVEKTIADSCPAEIKILMNDIRGDGWQVIKHDLPKSGFNLRTADTNVLTTKTLIVNDYNTYPNVKAVLILGHIAVPYSGWNNPDGHAEHRGAWPADVFYGDIDGIWTDTIINDTTAFDVDPAHPAPHQPLYSNWNIPGDGKFDQDIIPSEVELQVSRIDMSNMPAFPLSEIQMMKNYLAKDHAFKMGALKVRRRGTWCNWISWSNRNCRPVQSEAFRNFPPILSRDSIKEVGVYKDMLIPAMAAGSYLWIYGSAFAWNDHTGGIGSTYDMVGQPNHSIFSIYGGSYFGDWDVKNNFMRAPLCQNPPALTTCYGGGNAGWLFQHMALGENIGYSTILTQNNGRSKKPVGFLTPALYTLILEEGGYGTKNIALLGDLTLRTDYIIPPADLVVTSPNKYDALLSWSASFEPGVLGYFVYRSDSEYGLYQKLTDTILNTVSYYDTTAVDGINYYMVRPVKLTTTPSGSYFNLGVGVVDSINIESPVSVFEENQSPFNLLVYPNPSTGKATIQFSINESQNIIIRMTDMQGKRVFSEMKNHFSGVYKKTINLRLLSKGTYSVKILTEKGSKSKLLILN